MFKTPKADFRPELKQSFLDTPVSSSPEKNSHTSILNKLSNVLRRKRAESIGSESSDSSFEMDPDNLPNNEEPKEKPAFIVLTKDLVKCCNDLGKVLNLIHAPKELKEEMYIIIKKLETEHETVYPIKKLAEKAIPGLAELTKYIAIMLPKYRARLEELEINNKNFEFRKLNFILDEVISEFKLKKDLTDLRDQVAGITTPMRVR